MGQSAAVMVLDHLPDDEELEELAYAHLDEYDDESAEASADIIFEAPDFMSTCERDQINAHMRDGGACILVLYITYADEVDEE